MATYAFSTLLNTTDGMTVVHSGSYITKDTTKEVTGVSWYFFAGKVASKLYVNGASWIGIGENTHHLEAFYKSTEVATTSYIARQDGVLDTGTKFFKLRIEGSSNESYTGSYSFAYEMFLFSDGNMYFHVIGTPSYSSAMGDTRLYDGKLLSTGSRAYVNPWKALEYSSTKPLKRTISNIGISTTVASKMYVPIKESGVRVKTNPAAAYTGDSFSWSQMVIESYDVSGNTNVVSNFVLPSIDMSQPVSKSVTLNYNGRSISVPIVVKENVVTQITTVTMSQDYLIGDEIKISSVGIKWESGKYEGITSGFTVIGFDSSATGTITVTISYGAASIEREVRIHNSVQFVATNPKTQYLIGINDFEEPSMCLVYDDGTSVNVYGTTFTGFDNSVLGNCTITATYNEYTTTFEVEITDTITANIGYPNESDVVASLNITTGILSITGTGQTKIIPDADYMGYGKLFDDGGLTDAYVKEAVFSEGLTNITNICAGMSNLQKVTLPSTLEVISRNDSGDDMNCGCFDRCSKLTEINLPEGLVCVAKCAFRNCSALTSLRIPESVMTISKYAFVGCNNLELEISGRGTYIESGQYTAWKTKLIKGYIGSTAENYAYQQGIEFQPLNTIQSIELARLPYKIAYWALAEIDISGLTVNGTDENGVTVTLLNEKLTIEYPDTSTAGTKNVVIRYGELQESFEITVTNPTFEDILSKTLNDAKGMKTGDTMKIPWFMFDGQSCTKVQADHGMIRFGGTGKIKTTVYAEASNRYYYMMLETILDNGIRVAKLMEDYYVGYKPDYARYEIFFFSNGDIFVNIIKMPFWYVYDPNDRQMGYLKSNGNTYNFKIKSETPAKIVCQHSDGQGLDWKVYQGDYSFPKVPESIEITTLPKIDYFTGESLSMDGAVVTRIYEDGTTDRAEKFTVETPNMQTFGVQEVIVTEGEFGVKGKFTIYVNIKTEIGKDIAGDIISETDIRNGILKIHGAGATKDYSYSDLPPHTVASDYINSVEISAGITRIGNCLLYGFRNLVTVSGTESLKEIGELAFAYCDELSGEVDLNSIEVIESGAFYGEASANKISSIYIGEKVRTIRRDSFLHCNEIKRIEINKLTNSMPDAPWGAVNATVNWLVFVKLLCITPPTKTIYVVGEEFIPDGLGVIADLSDGTTKEVTDYEVLGFDSKSKGTKTVTVSFLGVGATFEIVVYGNVIGIRIVHYPTKKYYSIGDTLDLSGMSVAEVIDGETERTITNYSVSGFQSTKTGAQNIYISYKYEYGTNAPKTFYAQFNVNVTSDGSNPFDVPTGGGGTTPTPNKADQINILVHFIDGNFEDLTNEHIQANSMALQESICKEGYFIFGGCVANKLTFKVFHPQFVGTDENSYPAGRIEVTLERKGTTVKIFTGEIDSGERDAGLMTRTIVAYDYLYKWRNTDIAWWYKNETVDKHIMLTQKQFRDALFQYLGIEQVPTELYYDSALVPNTNVSNEINVVNTLKDLCLQNSVFGWMNRDGKFEYMTVPENSRWKAETLAGVKIYEYFEAQIHLDTFKSFKATEGKIWFPKEFLTIPYPGVFYSGEPTAQEAYESNVYFNRNSFFVGNQDWLDSAFQANEYGIYTRMEPIFPICYGTRTRTPDQPVWRAQGYTAEVIGNPLNMVGSTVELSVKKKAADGSEVIWTVHSYIMSRTLKVGNTMLLDTYSANNAPYNGNNRQEGKHTAEFSAELFRTRSELPTISYAEFTDGTDDPGFMALAEGEVEQPKKAPLRCMKRMTKADYDALGEKRLDTLYFTFEEA